MASGLSRVMRRGGGIEGLIVGRGLPTLYRGVPTEEKDRLRWGSGSMSGGLWRVGRYVVAVLAFGVVAAAWHFGTRQSGGIRPASERREVPELVMAQLDGGTWRMSEHRGQVLLVNYWATWCGPCWEETPGLIRLSRELGPKGLAVVGVAIDEGKADKVEKFVKDFGVPYPVVRPERLSQMEYGMEGVPTTVLVDRQGRVAKTYVGAVRQADFATDVETLLAER
jgi:cytochrome c biogenesis protein CcmG/thiol:disulfide interchange protein DsbE